MIDRAATGAVQRRRPQNAG